MSYSSGSELLGTAEVCEALGLSRGALHARRRGGDFPEPVAALRAGPVWTRAQIVGYARARSERLVERAGVVALARGEASPVPAAGGAVPVAEAARMLGVSPAQLEHVALTHPGLGGSWHVKTGRLLSVERDQLGLFGRALGRPVERAVVGCE